MSSLFYFIFILSLLDSSLLFVTLERFQGNFCKGKISFVHLILSASLSIKDLTRMPPPPPSPLPSFHPFKAFLVASLIPANVFFLSVRLKFAKPEMKLKF